MPRTRSTILVAAAATALLAVVLPAGAATQESAQSPRFHAPAIPVPEVPESALPDLTSASPLDVGDAVPPRNPAAADPEPERGTARLGAAEVAAAPLSFSFKASAFGIYTAPRNEYPYARLHPIALVDSGVHDSAGVRMHRIGTRLYDHPVGQAGYGLDNLESYVLTNDVRYLNRAKAQAKRLMDRARKVGTAWYLPYPFDFNLHGRSAERMVAPWYSAMAQGQALSLFVRLHELTTDATYRNAADGVFASFLRPRATSSPWVVWVDSKRHLWLEEYPRSTPDRTLNGHMFAAFGVWDYWRLTQDDRAKLLYQGALTMVADYFTSFRNTSWISQYCLQHPSSLSDKYHLIHIAQMFSMMAISRNLTFARLAEALIRDYPPPLVSGTVSFAAGTHEGVKFTRQGTVAGRKKVTLARASGAPGNRRIRIQGQPGFWYHITAGALTGHYVQEKWAISTMRGRYVTYHYYPARRVTMKANTQYIGIEFDSTGTRILSQETVTPTAATGFGVVTTAIFNGREHLLASSGPLAGRWIARYTLLT